MTEPGPVQRVFDRPRVAEKLLQELLNRITRRLDPTLLVDDVCNRFCSHAAIRGKKSARLLNLLRLREHLLRTRPHAKVLSEIPPAHRAAAVDEELRRPRDVVTVLARTFVQQVVALDRD